MEEAKDEIIARAIARKEQHDENCRTALPLLYPFPSEEALELALTTYIDSKVFEQILINERAHLHYYLKDPKNSFQRELIEEYNERLKELLEIYKRIKH